MTIKKLIERIKYSSCIDQDCIDNKEIIKIMSDTIKKLEAIEKKEKDKANSKYKKHFSKSFLTEDDEEQIASEIIKIVGSKEGYELDTITHSGYENNCGHYSNILIKNDESKIRISISNFMNGINYDYHEQFDYLEAMLEKLINVANNINEIEYSKFNIESKGKK